MTFVGYERIEADTEVTALRELPEGRVAVMLRESPFYVESGGQVSDRGTIVGEGWKVDVDEVRRIDGKPTAIGKAEGTVTAGKAKAIVPRDAIVAHVPNLKRPWRNWVVNSDQGWVI